jgi:hypothetical protein
VISIPGVMPELRRTMLASVVRLPSHRNAEIFSRTLLGQERLGYADRQDQHSDHCPFSKT